MEYFTHLSEYHLITCKKCRYAVLPNQVDSHLRSAKHRIVPEQRKVIQEEIATWPVLIQTETQLRIPTHKPTMIPELATESNGRKCDTCNRIMCTDEGIKKHCRIEHKWVNQWKRGPKVSDRRRAGHNNQRPWTCPYIVFLLRLDTGLGKSPSRHGRIDRAFPGESNGTTLISIGAVLASQSGVENGVSRAGLIEYAKSVTTRLTIGLDCQERYTSCEERYTSITSSPDINAVTAYPYPAYTAFIILLQCLPSVNDPYPTTPTMLL